MVLTFMASQLFQILGYNFFFHLIFAKRYYLFQEYSLGIRLLYTIIQFSYLKSQQD
jgi:hypothetical protein